MCLRKSKSTYDFEIFQFSGVDALGIKDASILLHDSNAPSASTVQVPHRVQTHITKTLATQTNVSMTNDI
jgi:hypothetical protein